MATAPSYAATPKVGIAVISTANSNLDGSGALGMVLAAGANGSRIDKVNIKAIATTTAGMVRLFVNDGANSRLIEEVVVAAVTQSGTSPAFGALLQFENGICIPSGYSLLASTQNAESFVVTAFGGDF